MATTVNVKTKSGLQTVASARDLEWYADEPLEDGGTNTGPTAMEALAGALGSCMIITTELYARRKQWPLEAMEVHIELERFNGSEYPGYTGDSQYVHQIREKVVLHGDQLNDEQRVRLMEITTKCPVRRVLTTPTFFVSIEEPLKEA
jgi:putative redox protein